MSRASGFKPLKPGCIHMRCPYCGRKQSNVKREPELDHPTAFMVETACDKYRCSGGAKDIQSVFYDRRGRQLNGWLFLERRARAAASLGDTPDPNQGGSS